MAVPGSKFDGTGFEKLQIVQTHVAVLFGAGLSSARDLGLLAGRGIGVAAPLVRGDGDPGDLDCCSRPERLFVGLGTSVIFADDLRKPA